MEAVKNCNSCAHFKTKEGFFTDRCVDCGDESSESNPYPLWISRFTDLENNSHEDVVNHPKHYTVHPSGVECIQITEHMNFCLGNAMKYVWRAGEKHETPLEDLKKAKWYIEREIKKLENQ